MTHHLSFKLGVMTLDGFESASRKRKHAGESLGFEDHIHLVLHEESTRVYHGSLGENFEAKSVAFKRSCYLDLALLDEEDLVGQVTFFEEEILVVVGLSMQGEKQLVETTLRYSFEKPRPPQKALSESNQRVVILWQLAL